MSFEPLIEVLRGGQLESVHHGAVAVADAQGQLVAAVGDPDRATYLRSSAKPIQALPLVESGAADAFGLTPRQLAVICASHAGTPEHTEVVRSVQRAAGIDESDLQCGVHFPYDSVEAHRMREAGEEPTPNHNNCSGKHSGMLALARHLKASIADYLAPDHPVQRRILAELARLSGISEEAILIGVDGCSAPTFAVPLRAAASAFARLAEPTRLGVPQADACRRIFDAMATHPVLVAGPGAFDTRLMEAGAGRWISKGGAEGYHAVALRAGAAGPGSPALGIAVKIADGDTARRAVGAVVLAVLSELGCTFPANPPLDLEFGPRRLRNWRGLEVGETRIIFRLRA
jgi:L-asparaginase II